MFFDGFQRLFKGFKGFSMVFQGFQGFVKCVQWLFNGFSRVSDWFFKGFKGFSTGVQGFQGFLSFFLRCEFAEMAVSPPYELLYRNSSPKFPNQRLLRPNPGFGAIGRKQKALELGAKVFDFGKFWRKIGAHAECSLPWEKITAAFL